MRREGGREGGRDGGREGRREGGREGEREGGREEGREGGFSPCYPVPYIVYSRLGLLGSIQCISLFEARSQLTKELGFGIYIYLLALAL